jgi:hypothetical protein
VHSRYYFKSAVICAADFFVRACAYISMSNGKRPGSTIMSFKSKEIDEWNLKVLQQRCYATYGLDLTLDQVNQVYRFEQLRDTPSENHYFSFWEELDFEFAAFRDILTPQQFIIFKTKHKETIANHEQQLREQDKEYEKQLNAAKDMLHYYESNLLPDLQQHQIRIWPAFFTEREKIDYLKAEYKKFLDGKKKQILVEHFRHSRTLQPLLLELSLLRHKLSCLLPDYYSFRVSMNAPATAVADYLENKVRRATEMMMKELTTPLNALKEFEEATAAKHFGQKIGGWHVTIRREDENPMFILLIDKIGSENLNT